MLLPVLLSESNALLAQAQSVPFSFRFLLDMTGSVFSVAYPSTWFFFFIFLDLALLGWIRMSFGASFERTLEAAFNFQTAVRMYNDNSQLQRQLDSILNVFFFLNIAFLLLLLENHFKVFPFGLEGFVLFLLNFSALLAYFLLRAALMGISGFLFNSSNIFREYSYHISNYNKMAGIVSAPFLLALVYTPENIRNYLFWFVLALILLIYILRIIRGLIFSWKRNIFIFYMFLYLCALEIVPLLLLFKWTETVI